MKVYILEYVKDKSIFSWITTFFTKVKYSHTAMFMDGWFCELDAFDVYKGEPDYHMYKWINIKNFLTESQERNRIEAYEIPYKFTKMQIEQGLSWWRCRMADKKVYGYSKLLSFIWLVPLRPFLRRYYRKHSKPYNIKTSSTKNDVCSIAVDKCLLSMCYDIFPEFDERSTYPGLYAKKLKDHKYKI